MKRYLSIFLCLCLFLALFAETAEVQNVRFEDQGESIVIHYDLLGNSEKKYNVAIALSNDEGQKFSMSGKTMTGDVGKGIVSGPNKTIVWRMVDDYPEGLEGDAFVFSVTASLQKKKSKTWMYVAGGVAAAALVVSLTGGGGEKDKGRVTISVSDQY